MSNRFPNSIMLAGTHFSSTTIAPCNITSLRDEALHDPMDGTTEIKQLFVRRVLARSLLPRTQRDEVGRGLRQTR